MAPQPTVGAAWQQALGAEHAAIFGYRRLGPWLTGRDAAAAQAALAAHQALRDAATAGMLSERIVPSAPQADYPLAEPLTGDAVARALAVDIETASAAAWRYLIAICADPLLGPGGVSAARREQLRDTAQAALTGCAVRAMQWRRLITPGVPTVPFPGI